MPASKQRIYALLLGLGACILIFRTTHLVYVGSLEVLVLWVSSLIFVEMAIDIACLAASIRWWVADNTRASHLPLRLGAVAAILHAFRVLIFVLGRTRPFFNFDVRPDQHAQHSTMWAWHWVVFAAVMSILGIVGVIVIWRLRRRAGL